MRTPLLLYGLAFVVRALLIWHFPDPAYPDSAYYVDVARSLHAGQGFNVDFIWIFAEVGGVIPADPTLPIPSNAHWMPLASIVQVPFLTIFGDVAWAAAAPFALIGSLAAPLTWAIARDAGARSFVAIGAGVLVAIPLLSTVFMAQPDNFSLYQPLVIASLWMAARGLRGSGTLVRRSGPLRRRRDPGPQRRTPRPGVAGCRLRLGSMARLALVRCPATRHLLRGGGRSRRRSSAW